MKYRTRKKLRAVVPRVLIICGLATSVVSGSRLTNYAVMMESSSATYEELSQSIASNDTNDEEILNKLAQWQQEREDQRSSEQALSDQRLDIYLTAQERKQKEEERRKEEEHKKALAQLQIDLFPKWMGLYDYEDIYRSNTDTRGYIYLPNQTSFPVMEKTEDEHFYLRRDFKGNHNMNGTPYLDTRSAGLGEKGISTIYGHNMSSGAMFACLKYYLNPDYLKQHKHMQLDSVDCPYGYEVVAVLLVNANAKNSIYDHIGKLDKEEFAVWKKLAKKDVRLGSVDELTKNDSIVELSTCNDFMWEGREIVVMKLVYPYTEKKLEEIYNEKHKED